MFLVFLHQTAQFFKSSNIPIYSYQIRFLTTTKNPVFRVIINSTWIYFLNVLTTSRTIYYYVTVYLSPYLVGEFSLHLKKWQVFNLLINLRPTQNLHALNCFRTLIRRPALILSSVITSWQILILETKSALLFRLMKNSLSGDIIRTQKLSFIIRTVGQRFPGHLLAWDFVKENWNKLVQK